MVTDPPTVKSIVDALGGRPDAASLCGVGYTAVSNWIAWNRFPARHHLTISRACERLTPPCACPDELFEDERREGARCA